MCRAVISGDDPYEGEETIQVRIPRPAPLDEPSESTANAVLLQFCLHL